MPRTSTAPFADAASLFWGQASGKIVAAGAIVATLGALNGWILIQGQIPMAAAQDRLFPTLFLKTNINRAPIFGIILSSSLASIVMILRFSESLVNTFTFMMNLSTLSVLTPYLLSSISLILLLKRKQAATNASIFVAVLAILFCIWVIFGSGTEVLFWGILLLLIGIPFYFSFNQK